MVVCRSNALLALAVYADCPLSPLWPLGAGAPASVDVIIILAWRASPLLHRSRHPITGGAIIKNTSCPAKVGSPVTVC